MTLRITSVANFRQDVTSRYRCVALLMTTHISARCRDAALAAGRRFDNGYYLSTDRVVAK